ncbi:MAG: hypothetical protein QM765_51805 [Myxococcales bacterium]
MDPLPPPATPPSAQLDDARCALHPDASAAFVCQRCGAFGCEACRADAATDQCQACAARAQAALGAQVTVGETLGRSFKLPFEEWRATLVCIALATVPDLVWALTADWLAPGPFGDDSLFTSFGKAQTHDFAAVQNLLLAYAPQLAVTAVAKAISFVIGLVGAGALVATFVGRVEGKPLPLRDTYALASRRIVPLLAVNMVVQLASLVGTFLCILPGLACMVLGMFIDPAVVLGKHGPLTAVLCSVRLSAKVLAPVIVLVLLVTGGAALLGYPTSLLRSVLQDAPLLARGLEGLAGAVGRIVTLPAIAGSAYLWVRLEAEAKLFAADHPPGSL